MSNFQEAGRNLSGNNKMVDDRHNGGGSKNVIGRKTKIEGHPIIGDKSGNKIKRVNNTTVNINNNVDIGKLCLQVTAVTLLFLQCSICTNMFWFMISLSFHLHKDAMIASIITLLLDHRYGSTIS